MKCVIIASIWGSFYSMYYIVERGSIYVSNIIIHCSISIYDVIPSHLIEMTLKMMPIFIFQIVFGTSIYKHFYCETNPSEWSKKRKLSLSNFWNSINELNGRLMRQLQGLPNQVLLIS